MSTAVELDGGAASLVDGEALAYLEQRGTEVTFDEGRTILRRGETGQAFWVVLKGEVEVRLESGVDRHLTLARLGPGRTFGELAILRSAPVAADVVAITPVTLLRYPAELLATALAECEPLRRALLSRLAHDLHQTTTEAWDFYRRTRALAGLSQEAMSPDAMVAVSARMRTIKDTIVRTAPSRDPVLVSGEPGTGKLLTARLLHCLSGRQGSPMIALDCRELAGRNAALLLFGGEVDGQRGKGNESFGALHLAHGGTLVLRGIDQLDADAQEELQRLLEADRSSEEVPFPDVRLIATVADQDGGETEDGLSGELRRQFETVIRMPSLAERPRDVVPLARSFLEAAEETRHLVLTSSAERALVSLKYRQRNVDELRSIVDLAARVSDGDEIRAEHVFSGFDEEKPIGLDLTGFFFVRWLVAARGVRLLRLLVAAGFLGVAAVCLSAAASPTGRIANGLVWTIWEPVVFGIFLLVGSLWCTVCPLSSSGRLAKRLFALERPPPAWLLRAGGWLSAAGFVLILWSEEFFDMTTAPVATGVMLIALVAAAVVCCVIWQREVWCRHLCPLGRLGVALAPVAPTAVAARRSVCASTCTTHDCYKGNESEIGCPVYHHPQLVSEGHRCKVCLTCLRSCPHGSTGFFLRPRLRSAWRLVSAESYTVPLALTVFFLSPVLIVAQSGGTLAEPLWLTLSCTLTLGAAALLAPILTPLLQGSAARGTAMTARVACALLVLGWGPLMAYQMDHIPLLHSLTIVARDGTLWALWPGPEITAVTVARVAFVIFAAILSAIILWNARGQAIHTGERINTGGWTVLIVSVSIYTFGSLWLVV